MKRVAVLGVTVVAVLGFAAFGCSSSSNNNTAAGGSAAGGSTSAETGGSSSPGGTNSSAGGKTSAGGSSSSSTSNGGSTAGGATSCPTIDVAPTNGLIADFASADAGIEIKGGVSTYGGTAAPTATIANGTLTITENAAATASAQYVGTVLYFNNCVDASAYSGVEFMISGSISGCTLQYSHNYAAADDVTTDPKGGCTLGAGKCYSPQKAIAATSITSTPTQMQIAWADTGTAGSPVGPVDKSKLTGIQWQFTIAASGTSPCAANLTISDIKFY